MANVPFRNLELNNLSFRQLQYISTNNSIAPNGYFMAAVNNSIIPRDPVAMLSTYASIDLNYFNSTLSTYAIIIPQISTNTDTALRLAQAAGPAISTLSTSVGGSINTLSNTTAIQILSLGNSISTVSTSAGIGLMGVNSLGSSLSTVSTTAGQALYMTGSISSISTFTGNNTIAIAGLGATISSQSTVLGHVEIGLSTVSTSAGLNIGPTGATGPTGPTGDSATWANYVAVADVRLGSSTIRDFTGMVMSTNTLGGDRCVVFGSNNSTFGTGTVMCGTNNRVDGFTSNTYDLVGGNLNSVISSLGYNTLFGRSNILSNVQYSIVEGLLNTVSNCSYSHVEGTSNRVIRDYSHAEGQFNRINGTFSHAEGAFNSISTTLSHAEGTSNIILAPFGGFSHIEGLSNITGGLGSHVEGQSNYAMGYYSHTEGRHNSTMGYGGHVEGMNNTVLSNYSRATGLAARAAIPVSQTYGHGFFTNSSNIPVIGSAQTTILTMTAGTNNAGVFKPLHYWDPFSENITSFSLMSTLSTVVMSNENYPLSHTYNLALTGYNSNYGTLGGLLAGKGYYYAEYRASMYFDALSNALYVGNLVGATFTAATSSPITLTAANTANNLVNAPTITVRARANVLSAASNAAQISFEVASSDARVTNYYAHVRIDEVLMPLVDPFY